MRRTRGRRRRARRARLRGWTAWRPAPPPWSAPPAATSAPTWSQSPTTTPRWACLPAWRLLPAYLAGWLPASLPFCSCPHPPRRCLLPLLPPPLATTAPHPLLPSPCRPPTPAVLPGLCAGIHVHRHADDGVGFAGGGSQGAAPPFGCLPCCLPAATHAASGCPPCCVLAVQPCSPPAAAAAAAPARLAACACWPPCCCCQPASWWRTHRPSPRPPLVQYLINVGWTSVWVKVVSQWVTVGLYCWTLVAPQLFPDRDFA